MWNKKKTDGEPKAPREFTSVQGKRADLDNKFFRSKWEANYARYLNLLKANGEIAEWYYENKEFEFKGIKRGNKFYKNDFEVIYKDGRSELHEVKGYMDSGSKTKLKRMAKYYPEVKIKIVDKAWFKANGPTIKSLIKNWE